MNALCLVEILCLSYVTVELAEAALRDFDNCHDDFTLKPPDGVLPRNSFKWLAFVEYKHVLTGSTHDNLAPRVVLIQKQYALGPAKELIHVPDHYKLGNVIFGEYEREEEECGLTMDALKEGKRCAHAYLEMPLLSITPHPEFSRFGVMNSIALVKLLRPMKSRYMMPICLPTMGERAKKKRKFMVYMIDYVSVVPYDFTYERMGKKTVKLYTDEACTSRSSHGEWIKISNFLCTEGCGVRIGTPIIIQGTEGAFELIGIAVGGGDVCRTKAYRDQFNDDPPIYIDVYPYSTWIINVVTANELPQAYQSNFRRFDAQGTSMALHSNYLRQKKKIQFEGWRSRTFLVGNFCRKSLSKQKRAKASFFYFEKFEVISGMDSTTVSLKMTISAGIDCTIICARLMLPSRFTTPNIVGIGGFNISVEFKTNQFPNRFYYTLGLTGKNSSQRKIDKWIEYVPKDMRHNG